MNQCCSVSSIESESISAFEAVQSETFIVIYSIYEKCASEWFHIVMLIEMELYGVHNEWYW